MSVNGKSIAYHSIDRLYYRCSLRNLAPGRPAESSKQTQTPCSAECSVATTCQMNIYLVIPLQRVIIGIASLRGGSSFRCYNSVQQMIAGVKYAFTTEAREWVMIFGKHGAHAGECNVECCIGITSSCGAAALDRDTVRIYALHNAVVLTKLAVLSML